MPRKVDAACMFCSEEELCDSHKPKEKKKAASRGTKPVPAPTSTPTSQPVPSPTTKTESEKDALKAAMKAAVSSAPKLTDTPSSLPATRRKPQSLTTLPGMDPVSPQLTRPTVHSSPAPVQVDARASMKESVSQDCQALMTEHDELLGCIEVLRSILDPAEVKPYAGELWKRRNRARDSAT